METCIPLRREMLVNPVDVEIGDNEMDFETAKDAADRKARQIAEDAMLVTWFDRQRGQFSPPVECGGKAKPAWLVYAETRGANITVSVNRETFVFVYLAPVDN